MEQIPYNQQQWKLRPRTIVRCKACARPVIWMKTMMGKPVMVHPMKEINRMPGVRVIDEQGMVLIDSEPKIGWREHVCPKAAKGKDA